MYVCCLYLQNSDSGGDHDTAYTVGGEPEAWLQTAVREQAGIVNQAAQVNTHHTQCQPTLCMAK